MKKLYITLFIGCCILVSAQSKEDYKKDIEVLKNELIAKDNELKKKSAELDNLKNKGVPAHAAPSADSKFQQILADNNRVFFYEIFENKYKKDPFYFSSTTLGKFEDLHKFENYNVVLANIITDKSKSREDVDLAVRATDFNNNYIGFLKLQEKYKDFFKVKYSGDFAKKYTEELGLLKLQEYDGLQKEINDITAKIEDYKTKSCELKIKLDKMKTFAATDNAALLTQYNALKKGYSNPYLQIVITDMSKNLASYTDDRLPACGTVKNEKSLFGNSGVEKQEKSKDRKGEELNKNDADLTEKNIKRDEAQKDEAEKEGNREETSTK